MPRHGGKSAALPSGLRRSVLSGGGALVLVGALAGCGSASGTSGGSASSASNGSSGEMAVHIENATIDRAEVEHWAAVSGRGNSVGTALGPTSGTPRERALEFLISSSWVLGEAADEGLSISSAAVEQGLREKIDALPNGRSELDEELSSTGQTPADVKLEVKSSLAAAMLRNAVAKRVPAVTPIEVANYYAHHRRSFYEPNRRLAYLIEGIHEYAHAVALARQFKADGRLAKPWFRELVLETREAADRRTLAHMVFTATPGRVAGPGRFFGHWVLAVVRKLIPAGIQPLSAVRGELSKTLAVGRRDRALKQFAAAFVRKWTARTSCSPGYIVQKCSEYRGAHAGERNPLTGA